VLSLDFAFVERDQKVLSGVGNRVKLDVHRG
jgi:hypothetical protein